MKLNLSGIFIYPVKSLPGVAVGEAVAEDRGLRGDRRWMLIDPHGRFISLREERKLMQFTVRAAGDNFEIGWENDKLLLPADYTGGRSVEVTIWEDTVQAMEGENAWSEWFSSRLDRPCRLVHMPPSAHRPVKSDWQLKGEGVSFADGYPYLVVNASSLQKLEVLTGQAMDVRRFRPNLVFSGDAPFAEFRYRELQVGEVVLNGLKPCARCVVTTFDPETGERGKEPLRTLATMAVNGKVVFGQHASLKSGGVLRKGDEVSILRHKDSPYDPL